jgi:hypothetical protein
MHEKQPKTLDQLKIGTLVNKVITEKTNRPGSPDHVHAIILLAQEAANDGRVIEIIKKASE